jgi:hypothetical protein
MSADLMWQVFIMVLVAAATYGAIRQDIKNIHEKIGNNEKSIDQAHSRIDSILMERRHSDH